MLRVCSILTTIALVTAVPATASAHDLYRFIGYVVKYDASKEKLEMTAREIDDAGKVTEFQVKMSVPEDVVVTRQSEKVSRKELKPGVFIIVDAAGVEMIEIDATAIEIKPLPKPAPAAKPPAPSKPAAPANTPAKKP